MSKLSEAMEELAEALDARDEAMADLESLEAEVAADHEDTHSGNFRWCERAACRAINRRGEP